MTISTVIFCLWYVAIASKSLLLVIMAKRGLSFQYFGLFTATAVSTARSIYLLWTLWTHGVAGYSDAWINSQSITIATYAVMAVEGFYAQARGFRRIGAFGVVLLVVFGGLSTLAMLSVAGFLGELWAGVAQSLTMLTRNYAGICAAMAGMSWLFFRPLRVSQNARTHIGVCLVFFTGEFSAMTLRYASHGSYNMMAVSQIIGQAIPILCYWLWITGLRPGGAVAPNTSPDPDLSGSSLTIRRDVADVHDILKDLRSAY